MHYSTPEVVDFGDLTELTRAQGMIGAEDGIGKAIDSNGISVAIVP